MLQKQVNRLRRKVRVRSQIHETAECPRLSVFRSNLHMYAQIIDDDAWTTLASSSDLHFDEKLSKLELAKKVGLAIAQVASEKKIDKVVFDRNGFLYHGRIKALADAAREWGLQF